MTGPAYHLIEDIRPALGLIVLQTDETIEDDFRRLFSPAQIRLYISRVTSGAVLNAEMIQTMQRSLPAAARLLPPAVRFKAVGYACTSGTTVIGAQKVSALVQSGCTTDAVTDPLTAAQAAIRHLGLRRVGIVSPYVPSIADALTRTITAGGVTVPAALSFSEEVEANVARIAPASLVAAATDLAAGAALDGIFLSCTNLRTLDIIDDLEARLGCPVISSNQALAWHLAQGRVTLNGPGRLLAG